MNEVQLLLMLFVLFNFQKHDIFKKRLDSHGNVIEQRQDGIGAPKVSNCLRFFLLDQLPHMYVCACVFIRLVKLILLCFSFEMLSESAIVELQAGIVLPKTLVSTNFSFLFFSLLFRPLICCFSWHRLRSLYRDMVAGLSTMRHIVGPVMEQNRYVCLSGYLLSKWTLFMVVYALYCGECWIIS